MTPEPTQKMTKKTVISGANNGQQSLWRARLPETARGL